MTEHSKTARLLRNMKQTTPKVTPMTQGMVLPNQSGDHSAGNVMTTPTADIDIANKKYVDDEQGNHNIADHNDTTATGAELNTLTDNSVANTLHRHSELVASDGSPDPALSVDATGQVGIGTTSPGTNLHIVNLGHSKLYIETTGGDAYTVLQLRNSADGTYGTIGLTPDGKFIFGNEDSAASSHLVIDNGNIGIGTMTPATSALLDLTSTTGALLLSRMTTAQRDALTAVNGMILYNTTLNKVQVYEGGAWASVI